MRDLKKRKAYLLSIAAVFIIIAYIVEALLIFPRLSEVDNLGLNKLNPFYLESIPFYLFVLTSTIVLILNRRNLLDYSYSIGIIGWSLAIFSLDIVFPYYPSSSILFIIVIFGVAVFYKNYVIQILYFIPIFSLLVISLYNIGYPERFVYAEVPNDFSIITITSFVLVYLISILFVTSVQSYEEKLNRQNLDLSNQKTILEEQKATIIQLENQRKSFFINTAHELRTSLTLVLGPLNRLIQDPSLRLATKESLEAILLNSSQMKGIVNQLLDSEKIENGVLKPTKEAFRLERLLKNVLESFDSIATHKNINYKKNIQLDTDQYIQTDKFKLKLILTNILINAFKFTDAKGTVLFKASEKDQVLFFEIKDTGRGIDAAYLPHIFNIFYQVPSSEAVSQGSGLGLYIVKEYLKILGGKIEVESNLAFGTTFSIQIPYEKIAESLSTRTTSPIIKATPVPLYTENKVAFKKVEDKSQPVANKQAILLVEDSIKLNDFLKSVLIDKYDIHQVYDGQEALNYLETAQELPDIIISDVMMPNVDGLELLKKIRHNPKYTWLPVILLTAKYGLEYKIEGLRVGADDYLTKPFEEEELFARINNLLRNKKRRVLFNQNTPSLASAPLSVMGEVISQEEEAWLKELEKVCLAKIGNLNLTISDITDEMSISRAQFFRRVKKLTGLNPGEYLQETRLQEALKLISSKKYSTVKAVAYSVGFKSEKYFSKKFKTRFGIYPSKYHQDSGPLNINRTSL